MLHRNTSATVKFRVQVTERMQQNIEHHRYGTGNTKEVEDISKPLSKKHSSVCQALQLGDL